MILICSTYCFSRKKKKIRILYCDLYSLSQFKKYWSLAIMWNLIVMDLFQPDFWNHQRNHIILSHLYMISRPQTIVKLQLYVSVLALLCNLESRVICFFFLTKWHAISYVLIWDLLTVLRGGIEIAVPMAEARPPPFRPLLPEYTDVPWYLASGHSSMPNQYNGFVSPIHKLKMCITRWWIVD